MLLTEFHVRAALSEWEKHPITVLRRAKQSAAYALDMKADQLNVQASHSGDYVYFTITPAAI